MGPVRHSLWIQTRVFFIVVALFLLALPLSLLNDYYYHSEPSRLLTPELMTLQEAFLVGIGLTFPYWIYLLLKRVRPLLREKSPLFKWIYYPLSVLFQLAIILGVVAPLIFTSVGFIFGPNYLHRSKVSPDQKKVAYLYTQGLFCGYNIYIRNRWQMVATKDQDIISDCQSRGRPELFWDDESKKVRLIRPDGSEVQDRPDALRKGFDWGPH